LRRGTKTIAAAPAPIARDCSYAGRIGITAKKARRKSGTLALVARFPGNAALLGRTARTTVRFGEEKRRK